MANDFTEYTVAAAFTGTDAERRAFKVASRDPFELTETAHDFSIDPMVADCHAGGAVPASGTALPAGGMINLANDNALALPAGLRKVATVKPGAGAFNLIDTGGGVIGLTDPAPGNGRGMILQKAGLADNLVGHPPSEGWLDFLQIAWFRPAALGYQSVFGYGTGGQRFYGVYMNGGGALLEPLSGKGFAAVTANTWCQTAAHFRFAGGNIYVRTFLNGAEISPATGNVAIATSQATMNGWAFASGKALIGGNNTDPSTGGAIGAFDRIFTGIAEHVLDPQELVTANWNAKRARYGV